MPIPIPILLFLLVLSPTSPPDPSPLNMFFTSLASVSEGEASNSMPLVCRDVCKVGDRGFVGWREAFLGTATGSNVLSEIPEGLDSAWRT